MNISANVSVGEGSQKNLCFDIRCPHHGKLKVRGRTHIGTIISSKMHKTVVVEWEWKHYIPKYERYEKKRTRVKAHNPDCIMGVEGDIVKIMECRPLSKTKNFVIIKKIGREKGFLEKKEAREESKVQKPVKESGNITEITKDDKK